MRLRYKHLVVRVSLVTDSKTVPKFNIPVQPISLIEVSGFKSNLNKFAIKLVPFEALFSR